MEKQITITEWIQLAENVEIKKTVTFTVTKTEHEAMWKRFCKEFELEYDEAIVEFDHWLYEQLKVA